MLIAAGNAGDGTTDTYDIFDPAGDSGHGSFTRYQGMNGSHYANFNHYWHGEFLDLGGDHHKVMLVAENTESPYSDGPITSQIYDPVDGTWSTAVNTGMAAASVFDCARSGNGTIGCYAQVGWMNPEGLEVYDPATDSWSAHGYPANNGGGWVANHVVRPSITGLEDGKFLTINSNYCCDWNNSATFDSSTNTWEDSGRLPGSIIGGGITWRLPSGDVLMAGGMKDDRYSNDMSYLWNHNTGAWSEAGKITGDDSVGTSTEMSGGTFDKDGNPVFVTDGVLFARYSVADSHWDPNSFRQYHRWSDDPAATTPGAPITLDDGRTIVFGGGPVYSGRPQDRTWASNTYFYGNVPQPTSHPQVDKSLIGLNETVTVTSDATWDTPGITVDRRWKLCKRWSQCVDAGSNPTAASYTFTTADFAAGYDTLERVESYDDKSVGPQSTGAQVDVQAPAAPAANPAPRVNFTPSGQYTAGTVLHRTHGTWTGSNLGSVSSNWEKCGDFGDGWQCVDLGDSDTYTVTQDDIDRNIQLIYSEWVTDEYNQTTYNRPTGWIGPLQVPSVSDYSNSKTWPRQDIVSWAVPVGDTVTANPQITWSSPVDSVEYRWQYSDRELGWVDVPDSNKLTFDTTGLAPGTPFHLMARATNSVGTGDWTWVVQQATDRALWSPHARWSLNNWVSSCSTTSTAGGTDVRVSDPECSSMVNWFSALYGSDGTQWLRGLMFETPYVGKLSDDGTELYSNSNGNEFYGANGVWKQDSANLNDLDTETLARASTSIDAFAKVIKVTNNTTDPLTRVITESMQMDNDSDTNVIESNLGNAVFDPHMNWMVTQSGGSSYYSSYYSNAHSEMPYNTTAWGGACSAVQPDIVRNNDTGHRFGANYTVTVPAGESRYVVVFFGMGSLTEGSNDGQKAVDNARKYFADGSTVPADLLQDIPAGHRSKIVNWNVDGCAKPPSLTFKSWSKTASGVAKFTVGGATGAQIEVSNYANFKSPVTVTVGKSGSIKTLATKLGAGQVQIYYREKGKPASAASTTVKYDFYRPFISANSVRWAKTAKATWNAHLLASDKTCPGCDPKLTVQLAYGKAKPPEADPFPAALGRDVFVYRAYFTIKAPTPPRWVRVADSQGNVSAWKGLVGSPAFPAG